MSIPIDLEEFLSCTENLEMTLTDGEIRQVTFFTAKELTLQKFMVDSYDLYLNGLLKIDPKKQREYQGYSLILDCNGYCSEGIMIWFPEFQSYGSADTDHASIIIYPGMSWVQIINEPTWYISR